MSRLAPWLAVAALCSLLHPRHGRAEPAGDPATTARDLFEQGITLAKAGSWEKACASFDASAALYPNASAQLQVGKCREREGKLALAYEAYRRAVTLALEKRPGEPESRREARETVARDALASVERRIGRLRITVAPAPAGLRVTQDGAQIAPDALAEPIPADPGSHEIAAEAPGYEAQRRVIEVSAGTTLEVSLSLVSTSVAAPEEPAAPPLERTASIPKAPSAPPDVAPAGAARTARWVAGGALVGVGGAGLVAAAGLGVATLAKVGQSNAYCDESNLCKPDGIRLRAEAGELQTAGLVAAGVSAALALAGVAVLVTAPAPAPGKGSPALSLAITVTGAHLTLASPW